MSAAVGEIFAKKEDHIEASLANETRRFHPISGSCSTRVTQDIVNATFVVFSTIKVAAPAIAKLAPILIASSIFGVVEGVLCLAMGFVNLREAIQAFRNGDTGKGFRLLIMSLALFAISAFMIVSTIAAFVALGGIAVFIAANPWILPILILILMLPIMYEIAKNNKAILTGQDPYSMLKTDQMDKLFGADIVNWSEILNLLQDSDLNYETVLTEFEKHGLKSLSERMEILQSKMGAKGAVVSFKLFQAVLDKNKEDAQGHIRELKGHATDWKRVQYFRLAQQVLYIGSFALSMFALKSPHPRGLETADNAFLASGMGIPIYLDIFKPFLRNVPIIVPKVDVDSDRAEAI